MEGVLEQIESACLKLQVSFRLKYVIGMCSIFGRVLIGGLLRKAKEY